MGPVTTAGASRIGKEDSRRHITSLVFFTLLASACAPPAPETPNVAAAEPTLEVRVYFEGLMAFAPDPAGGANWLAALATAPAPPPGSPLPPTRAPHGPEVAFADNVEAANGTVRIPSW